MNPIAKIKNKKQKFKTLYDEKFNIYSVTLITPTSLSIDNIKTYSFEDYETLNVFKKQNKKKLLETKFIITYAYFEDGFVDKNIDFNEMSFGILKVICDYIADDEINFGTLCLKSIKLIRDKFTKSPLNTILGTWSKSIIPISVFDKIISQLKECN